MSTKLEYLPDGKYINVNNLREDGFGARIMPKPDTMRITLIQGLNIGTSTLDKYGLSLKMLINEKYLTFERAMYYYGKYMDAAGITGAGREDLYNRFYELIRPVMVKSAHKH